MREHPARVAERVEKRCGLCMSADSHCTAFTARRSEAQSGWEEIIPQGPSPISHPCAPSAAGMLCSGAEHSWPTCLSQLLILLERSHPCSPSPCDLFFPLLSVSPSSPPDLWLFLPDCVPHFIVLILHSSASCHSHPFHTSRLIIFAPFLSLTSVSLTSNISLPRSTPKTTSTPLLSALSCTLCPPPPTASDYTVYLTGGFPSPRSYLPSSRSPGRRGATGRGLPLRREISLPKIPFHDCKSQPEGRGT